MNRGATVTAIRKDRQSGSSLIELAVILPLLLVALLGAVDVGRAYYQSLVLCNAARAGAQYGAYSNETMTDSSGIQAAALADLQDAVAASDDDEVAVESERYCECGDGSSIACDGGVCDPMIAGTKHTYIRVLVSSDFETMFHYPGLPESIPLSHEVHLRAR